LAIQEAPSMNFYFSKLPLLAMVSTALSLFFKTSFSSTRALLYLSISFSMNLSLAFEALKFSMLRSSDFLELSESFEFRVFLSLVISTLCSFLILAISLMWESFMMVWASEKKSSMRRACYPPVLLVSRSLYFWIKVKISAGTVSSLM